MSRRSETIIAVLSVMGLCVSAARGQTTWSLVGGDLTSARVSVTALDERGVTVAEAGGASTRPASRLIDWSAVQELDREPAVPVVASNEPFDIYLNGGDCLHGVPMSIGDEKLSLLERTIGNFEIPEDRVNAIVRSGQSASDMDQARTTDSVRLTNGDVTTGIIEGLSQQEVKIRPAGADSASVVSMEKVAAILLATSTAAPNAGFRVWMTDGSSLTVKDVRTTPDGIKVFLNIEPKDAARAVDLSAITAIEQVAGPVKWLTGLPMQEAVYKPYFGEQFPPRVDHPPGTTAMTIHQKYPAFHHGIGVHSYTRLSYVVPAGYSAFRTQFAIDRIANADMSKADVTVRLYVDDQARQTIPHVRFGKVADAVVVPVKAGEKLSLEVDYGENLAAQGRLVWLDPAFVKQAFMSPLIVAHIVTGLTGIVAGAVVVWGLFHKNRIGWTSDVFVLATAAACATGFVFLPTDGVTSAQLVGFFVILLLAIATYSHHVQRLEGSWNQVYALTVVGALFLNILITLSQSFVHIKALATLAPTQESPVFVAVKLTILAVFVAMALLVAKRAGRP